VSSYRIIRASNCPTPSLVATVVDDVRYCGKSGLSADVEFLSEFDPKRT
jgi:hypothetical protein